MASARYRVQHETHYTYRSDVAHSHQLLHLIPRALAYQECLEQSIAIEPGSYHRRDEMDAFGNPLTRIELEHAHRYLKVTSHLDICVHARAAAAAHTTLP